MLSFVYLPPAWPSQVKSSFPSFSYSVNPQSSILALDIAHLVLHAGMDHLRSPFSIQGYVQCEACESWMHLECAGITAEDSTSSAPFTCADCADSSPAVAAVAAVVSRPSRSGGSGTKRKSPSSEAQGVVGDDADASITPSGTKQKSTPGPKTKGKIKGSGGSGGGATKGKAGAPKKHTSAPASVSAVVVASGDDVQDGGVPWAPLERGWEELNAAQKK